MEGKKIVGTRIYIKDITDRIQSEKKKQVEEERFRVMFESSKDLLSIVDSTGKTLLVNPSWIKTLGIPSKTQGIPIDKVHPKDRNHVKEAWGKVLKGKVDSIQLEYRYKTADRKYSYFETTIHPLQLGGEALFFINAHNVTFKKKTQSILKESEERFRKIIELTPLGMVRANTKGFVTDCNKEFLRLTGFSREEIVGKHITKLPTLQGMNLKTVVKLFQSLLKGGITSPMEFEWVRKDGEKRLGEVRASVFKRAGRISELQAVLIDVTDRKKAEENLRFSSAAFQSIQESIIATDLDYTITYWNKESERIYGIEASAVVGEKLTDILEITETFPGEAAEKRKILEIEGGYQDEQLHKTRKNVVWVSVRHQEIVGDGKRTGWIILATDISRRKIAEKKLRENEEFLISILESMSDGVMAINKDFQYTYWNKEMEHIFNTSRETRLYSEKKPWEISPELVEMGVDEMMKKAMRGEIVQKEEIYNRLKDGTESFTSEIYLPLKGAMGEIRGVIGVIKDISERKLAEQALKKSEEDLRNLAKHMESVRENQRTSIAREIHDELGQSLTALKMDVFWLQKKFGEKDNKLMEKTNSMIELTDLTIQTVKKICSELRPGLLDDLGLIPALEWQAEEFQNRFGIKCELQIESEDLVIDSQSSTALFRIFQETLTNVARHSQATKLTLILLEKNDRIEMIVKDNGIGISDEKLHHSKSFGLMGIKERILGLSGKILIQGVKDEGTTVTISIPVVKPVP